MRAVARSLVGLVKILRDMTVKIDEYEDYDCNKLKLSKE